MEKFIAAYLLIMFWVALAVAVVAVHLGGREMLHSVRLQHFYQVVGFINTVVAAVLCVIVLFG